MITHTLTMKQTSRHTPGAKRSANAVEQCSPALRELNNRLVTTRSSRFSDMFLHLVFSLPSFIIALWPIWQWVTIPIMIVFAFAACLGPNLIPF